MNNIQVQKNGDVYSCDIGISKEEWLEILQDEETPQSYKETVLRFYFYPGHRGTCTAVSNSFGDNAQKLSANVRELGRYVQKRLNRFQVVRPDGTPCFWIIPMCEGKDLPQGGEGSFEWELRPELVEAIREYLYWYLIEQYKKLRKEIPIDGDEWTELYKWQLITASKGKTPLEIIRSHVANPRKSELGGFDNLIDAARDNKTLIHLVGTNPEGLQEALGFLLDETKTLNERLANYKSAMASLLPANGFNSKANDERTASVILTCVNPEKYTIYKYDVYTLLCKYLGVEKKSAGQCYHHFLELIEPLRQLATHDKELHQIVTSSLKGQVQSDLLLAQDVLWMLFAEFPQRLGYIYNIMLPTKQRVWLWSIKVSEPWQETLDIGSSAKTIKDFRPFKSKNALRKAYQQDVGNSDLKIPDAYWSFINEINIGDIIVAFEPKKGNGKQYHLLHGWGIITSDCTLNEQNDNPMSREVQWYSALQIPKQNEEMGNSMFFQGTTDKQALHIKELLNINTDIEMESKYQKYIDLLEANKNLILTGAPGTGKTFMAKEIATILLDKDRVKDLKDDKHFGFVQFHPSYDYTDFVEGLRPESQGNGNVGFERKDGVFKEFCKRAALNASANNSSITTSFNELYERLLEEIRENKIDHFVQRTGAPIFIKEVSSNNNLILIVSKETKELTEQGLLDEDERIYTVSYNRLEKLSKTFPNKKALDSIGNIDKEIRAAIGGCNTSAFWAVLHTLWNLQENYEQPIANDVKPYIFVVDEINRGELSKIFGELFFSIDPGYRGIDGIVKTQYQNLVGEGDLFKDGFYVPENVYIIGTMNDIDRSVESMDFAMRRRFAWQEVTAEESYENMIENDSEFALVKDKIKQRMFSLNKAIAETEGLDEAYQIGAAYFRKYLDYQDKENPFECLWNNHLKGLLFEYLRGNRRAKELLEKLHKAYNKTNIDEQPAHTNNR